MPKQVLSTTTPPRVVCSVKAEAPASADRNSPPIDDLLLTTKEAAAFVNLSIAAFWRNVLSGRLPQPVYPAPRAPRWWRDRLRAAVNATQAHPTQAKQARRQEHNARLRAKEEPHSAA